MTIPSGAASTQIGGHEAWLLPERALNFPRQRILVIADLHVGKTAAFRAQALPMPGGVTSADLDRLSQLLVANRSERLVLLGDLLHAKAGRAPRTLDALAAWRARHAALDVVLVRGNHDRRAGDPPMELRFTVADGPLREPELGIAYRHEPAPTAGVYTLAGHLHPAVRLLGSGRQSETLACFAFGPEVAVLPAFGSFTGSARQRPVSGDRVFVIAGDQVVAFSEG
jgi:DNA ligase-associated metallophosphoesterase